MAVGSSRKDGKAVTVAVQGALITNDAQLALHAALDGMSIAYGLDFQGAIWLANGRLERVLVDWSPRFPGLSYPGTRQMPPVLRAVVNFLHQRNPPGIAADRP